ncbi:MAG: hypothetical protein V7641_5028 [Blastocatellia bacterium]
MLKGKNPLHLPPHSDRVPVEYSARCFCGARYLIFNPGVQSIGDAEGRARERAGQMHARFVNSSLEPFVMCVCGSALDFGEGEASELMT